MSNDIRVSGTPISYGDGATRNSKEGKGRFDLIPPGPYSILLSRLIFLCEHDQKIPCYPMEKIYALAFVDKNYVDTILALTAKHYIETHAVKVSKNFDGMVDHDAIMLGWWEMLYALAQHFQKGAEIYGPHNCEKGIPAWSFQDSGLRHMSQYLNGEKDEPHWISAIWNFWMLLWTELKEFETAIDTVKQEMVKTNQEVENKDLKFSMNVNNNIFFKNNN